MNKASLAETFLERAVSDVAYAERLRCRLAAKTVAAINGCHVFVGKRLPSGYGMMYLAHAPLSESGKRRTVTNYVHRIAFVLANHRMPTGEVIMHSCDNKSCVNPNHLEDGTHKQNSIDSVARNRRGPVVAKRGEDNPRAKYTAQQAMAVVALTGQGLTRKEIATRLQTTTSFVDNVRTGSCWSWITGKKKPPRRAA